MADGVASFELVDLLRNLIVSSILAALEDTFNINLMLCLFPFDMVGFARTNNVLVKIITRDRKILANFDRRLTSFGVHMTC